MAGSYDFDEVKQGDTFDELLHFYNEDESAVEMDGWTAHMQVRVSADDDTVILDFNTDDGTIVLGASDGSIQLLQTRSTMAAVEAGSYKYDLKLINDADEEDTLLEGKFKIKAQVTKESE